MTKPDSSPQKPPSKRTKGSGNQLRHRKLNLNLRKRVFSMQVVKCWKRLARDHPSMSPSMVLSNLLWLTLL